MCRLKRIVRNPVVKAAVDGAGRVDLEDIASANPVLVSSAEKRRERTGDGIRFEAGDVLFGKLRPYLRKSLLCDGLGLCSPELLVLRPDRSQVEPRFLHYVVRSNRFVALAVATSKGTKMPRTDFESIGRYEVEFPPLVAQRDIADFLDRETAALGALIEQKRRLIGLLDEKRAATGRAAVSGELTAARQQRRSSELSWLPTIPSHWKVAKLSLVARLGTGHTPSRSKAAYWETEREISWLTTGDIEQFRNDRLEVLRETKESISRLGLENSSAELHPAGTVALSRTASVGFSVIMGTEMATSQDFVTWTCSECLDPRFLLLCLRAMRVDLQNRLATGSTHKTIYMPVIQGLRIPLPPVDEQRRAVELAAEHTRGIDRLAGLVNRQLPLLGERRDALITAAVAGELDLPSHRATTVAA